MCVEFAQMQKQTNNNQQADILLMKETNQSNQNQQTKSSILNNFLTVSGSSIVLSVTQEVEQLVH